MTARSYAVLVEVRSRTENRWLEVFVDAYTVTEALVQGVQVSNARHRFTANGCQVEGITAAPASAIEDIRTLARIIANDRRLAQAPTTGTVQ